MKKNELTVGATYAYARGNESPVPARLLDLRLWKVRGTRSDPKSWTDVTDVFGARPGRGDGYSNVSTTGYLVLKPQNSGASMTGEQLAAIQVPPLPTDATAAAEVFTGLELPSGIVVEPVMTTHLRRQWEEYAKERDERAARDREARIQREYAIEKGELDWGTARRRLERVGVEGKRLMIDPRWREREPVVALTLTELTKLLDLAEGGTP